MTGTIKCKLCHSNMVPNGWDIIICACGEISIDGVNKKIICQKSQSNYVEIDDNGNAILNSSLEAICETSPPTQKELLDMFDDAIKAIDNLPPDAMMTYVTQYDLVSSLKVISGIFKAFQAL